MAVRSRRLPAHVRDAIKSGPVPTLRDWRKLHRDDLTRAERNMRFCEAHCIVPEGVLVGKPVRLADFQEAFFYALYDNPAETRMAILSKARKNAKTATIAMIVLVHLAGPEAVPNSEIMSGARSREQAAQVYKYASKMVQFSAELAKVCRLVPSNKKIIGLNRNVEYQAGAAEAKTAHGGSPIVAILDELGQVRGPRDDYVDAITTSQGAYESPLLIVISTQAPTDADMLSVWIDDAKSGSDPSIICHLYEADADADLMDKRQWRKANPALGLFRSESDVRSQADKACRMPSSENTFRNLTLNQRVAVMSPFVSKDVWASCNGDPAPMDGAIYGGLDLSARTDLTALVLAYKWGENWQIRPFFWTPEVGLHDRAKRDRVPYDLWAQQGYLRTTPGSTVDYEYVASDIADIIGANDLRAIAFDRWRIDVFKKDMERLGMSLPLVPHGQGFKDMSPALDTLEAALLNGRLRHGGHPVLTMCAANAVVTKDPAGNRKLDKGKANGRIDGMVALAMALAASSGEEVEEYAVGRLITL